MRLLGCVLTVAFFCVSISFSFVPKAHAQGLPVQDILNTIQTTLSALSSASLEQKELVWDGLFHDIATQALQQMTGDILEWANSGFDGEPAFVTDLLGYLQDVADDVAGDFIYGDELSTLCTPFKLDVITAVGKGYQQAQHGEVKDRLACGIDQIAGGNPEAFLEGTASAGGWSMWFEIAVNPQNTPLGAKLAAQAALADAVAEAQYAEQKDIDNGRGFRSQKVCKNGNEDCTIVKPGSIIADQVSFALQVPALKLIEADEMNEVIGALFGDLANQAITGVNGLLGLGGNASFSVNEFGASGELSYLDAVRAEQPNGAGGGGVAGNRIEDALRTETQVLELQLAIVTQLDEISTTFLDTREPYEDDSCWDLEFPETLTDKLDELLEEVPATIENVVTLESLLDAYTKATNPAGQLSALRQLSDLQSNGTLSGRTAVIQYDFYLKSELKSEITTLEEAIEDAEDSC